jgi:DNA (cytosine-5)-methyltransferase 1
MRFTDSVSEPDQSAESLAARYDQNGDEVSLVLTDRSGEYRSTVEVVGNHDDPHAAFWHSFLMGSHVQHDLTRETLRIADLFCGPGGLSQGVAFGARSLGFRTQHQLLVDIDNGALRVAAANHRPRVTLNESTAGLVSYSLRNIGDNVTFSSEPRLRSDLLESLVGEVDVLVAGPPCQGHSTANKNRKYFDQRNLLYLTVPAIAIALRVPTIIIENVPGVKASQQGVVQSTWKILESYGYSMTGEVLNAADIGWPQKRRRYFMVATLGRNPSDLKKIVMPALKERALSISEVLEDLVQVPQNTFMTQLSEMSSDNIRRIEYLHRENLYDLPDAERNQMAQKFGTSYRSVYGRMYWDQPAQTITTGFMTPGRGRYVHPLVPRTLLPVEAARLQGFPDSYSFDAYGVEPARTALAKWIGDAVPTPLGFAAAISALAV